jgi:hypothetical protein
MNRAILLIILFLTVMIRANSQNIDFEKLDAYIQKAAIDWGIPGMSVGIVRMAKLLSAKGTEFWKLANLKNLMEILYMQSPQTPRRLLQQLLQC